MFLCFYSKFFLLYCFSKYDYSLSLVNTLTYGWNQQLPMISVVVLKLDLLFSLHGLLTLWISGVNKPFPSAPQSHVDITFLTLVSFALCISYSGLVFHVFPRFPSLSRPACLMWMKKGRRSIVELACRTALTQHVVLGTWVAPVQIPLNNIAQLSDGLKILNFLN